MVQGILCENYSSDLKIPHDYGTLIFHTHVAVTLCRLVLRNVHGLKPGYSTDCLD